MQRTKEMWFEEMQNMPQENEPSITPLMEEVHMLCKAAGKTAEMGLAKKLIEKFNPYMNNTLMGWEVIQTIIDVTNAE
jgi:hypothetical protein